MSATVQHHPEYHDPTTSDRGSSSNRIEINLGGLTLVSIIFLAGIIGACGVEMGIDISDRHAAEREFTRRADQLTLQENLRAATLEREEDHRVTTLQRDIDQRTGDVIQNLKDLKTAYALEERRKIDIETYLMIHGWKRPGDDAHGPTGNLQRMVKEK